MLQARSLGAVLTFLKTLHLLKSTEKGVLEKFFNSDAETLAPVYKEIIRLIYREEIPK